MADYWSNLEQGNYQQQLGTGNGLQTESQRLEAGGPNSFGYDYGNSVGGANYGQETWDQAQQQVVQGSGGVSPYSYQNSQIQQGPNQLDGTSNPYNMSQLADTSGLMDLGNWAAGQASTFAPGGSSQAAQQYADQMNGAVTNPNLGLSQQFTQNYQMTPAMQQAQVNAAGQTVGAQFGNEMDAARRQASAAGMGPMGVDALQNRVAGQSAQQSGTAMSNAQLAAQMAALGVTQQGEAMRLGAAQTQAGDIMNSANSQAALGLSASEAGNQFESGMGQYIDQGLSNRLTGLVTGQQQYGLAGQGQAFNQALSGANQTSGQYATQAGLGLSQQQLSTQQELQSLGLDNSIYSTQGGLENSSTQLAAMLQTPGLFQQILGGLMGAAGSTGSLLTGIGNL